MLLRKNPSSVPLVSATVTFSKCVAIWAEEYQIFYPVIPIIAIYMMQFKRYGLALPFNKATLFADMLL